MKTPTFTKVHFEFIAACLAAAVREAKCTAGDPASAADELGALFAASLKGTNPRFDPEKFAQSVLLRAQAKPWAGF